jgi:heat shock protein HtpX
MQTEGLPQNMAAAGIAGGSSWMALFSTHPPLEERIAALNTTR